jgi:hypothetical protein
MADVFHHKKKTAQGCAMPKLSENRFIAILLVLVLPGLAACNSPGGTHAVDDAAPAVTSNTGAVVGEGGSHTILSSELSYHDSIQPAGGVRYTVISPPNNGWLEKVTAPREKLSQFTQADIDSGQVVFRHLRGHVTSSIFEFAVDDGAGNTLAGQKFTFEILPNPSDLNVSFSRGVVQLSWSRPSSAVIAGIEIRRRDDGRYPESPNDGLLIARVSPDTIQFSDVVTYDTSNGPVSRYYTAFSFDGDGNHSGGTRAGIYCDPARCVTVPELRDMNHILSPDDVVNLRKILIAGIWGVDSLPDWMPASITTVADGRFSGTQNLMGIQDLLVPMDYGLTSRMRYFTPLTANGKLVIHHQGHRGITSRDAVIIQRLLRDGFHVLDVSMPLQGYNYDPAGPYATHEDLANLDRPMRLFLEPLSVALNYLMSAQQFNAIYMTGISGGGWTTVVYAALDPRISASYPVAGSYPFYLREQLGGSSVGDFEQTNPAFYRLASYIELYLLGAAGRRQVQVYNVYDNCCFSGTYSNTFRDYVQASVTEIGGSFDTVLDDTIQGHEISDYALEAILGDIENTPAQSQSN